MGGAACRCFVYMAYFRVHSLDSSWYLALSVLYSRAISGTSGSSGFGSHSREQMESSTWQGGKYSTESLHCLGD